MSDLRESFECGQLWAAAGGCGAEEEEKEERGEGRGGEQREYACCWVDEILLI